MALAQQGKNVDEKILDNYMNRGIIQNITTNLISSYF